MVTEQQVVAVINTEAPEPEAVVVPLPEAPVKRRRHSVRVGVDLFLEYWVEGDSDETYVMLYLKSKSGGPPVPQLKEPLVAMDLDPWDLKKALDRSQWEARAAQGIPQPSRRQKRQGWDGRQQPFQQSLEGVRGGLAAEPKPKAKAKPRRSKRGSSRKRPRQRTPLEKALANLKSTEATFSTRW